MSSEPALVNRSDTPKRGRNPLVWGAFLVALLAVSLAIGGGIWACTVPLPLGHGASIRVEAGDSVAALAARLTRLGLIPDPLPLKLVARWRNLAARLRPGDYAVPEGTRLIDLVDLLRTAEPITVTVTIPEGLTAEEIGIRLADAGLGTVDGYRCLAASADFAEELAVPGGGLEGYLFPDTYTFDAGAGPDTVFGRMVDRFFAVFDADLVAAAHARGLFVDQAVTLASLIEEEAAVDAERALISAVFRNRLAIGMPLQSDPTARYGVADSGPITRADLRRVTPYNTYVIRGLPPGPISNPGRASLIAAVRPAPDSGVLYFVARGDRTHEFSNSLEAHQRAVRRWRGAARARQD